MAVLALLTAQTPGSGSISGTIRVPGGVVRSGVRVMAMAVPQPNAPEEATVYVRITQTDAEGRYQLEDIPPGLYYITSGTAAAPTYYPGTPDRARLP